MTALLIITGLLLTMAYAVTLYKNAVHTFIAGAAYRWLKANGDSSVIEPYVVKELIASNWFKFAKGLIGLLVISWLIMSFATDNLKVIALLPTGFIIAILFIKFSHSRFNTRNAIAKASKEVTNKRLKYVGQLTSNDIVNNTPKNQLSTLDLLLEKDEFIKFAQKLKRSFSGE